MAVAFRPSATGRRLAALAAGITGLPIVPVRPFERRRRPRSEPAAAEDAAALAPGDAPAVAGVVIDLGDEELLPPEVVG